MNRQSVTAYGAGRMGRGMAICFAYAGHKVTLVDSRAREDVPAYEAALDAELHQLAPARPAVPPSTGTCEKREKVEDSMKNRSSRKMTSMSGVSPSLRRTNLGASTRKSRLPRTGCYRAFRLGRNA